MMLDEFVQRTGFTPTWDEYKDIEERYCAFDGNKDEFCKSFIEHDEERRICKERARRIEQLQSCLIEQEKEARREAEAYERRIADLEAALEKAEEWKPCKGGTTFEQTRYEQLQNSGCAKILTDVEAAALVSDEFGFDPAKIEIIRTVHTYEANRFRAMRKANEYVREPVSASTDWNYIRFDCAGWQYEMVNGQLESYCT